MNDVVLNFPERDFYAVAAATNLYNYEDLNIFRTVNSLDYNLAIFSELGYFYNYFSGQFVFIGKDNRIVGILDSDAEKIEIEDLLNQAMATFSGVAAKTHLPYYFLKQDTERINLYELFTYRDFRDVEFSVTASSDESVCSYEVYGEEIILVKGSKYGHTDLTVELKIKGKDIILKTGLSVINLQHHNLEDFEYGSISESPLIWTTDNYSGWETDFTKSYSGNMSLKSGSIDHSMRSEISININLSNESAVTFAYKTDSYYEYYLDEIDGDFLNFYLNGINVTERENRELWGGRNDWRVVSYQLPAGENELKWQYLKNDWGASDKDAVWIDFIVIPEIISSTVSESGSDKKYELAICPNPFNPETEISFTLEEPQHVKLSIFDIKGREVIEIIDEEMNSGKHSFAVSPSKLSGGTYFTVFRAGNNTQVNKILFLK